MPPKKGNTKKEKDPKAAEDDELIILHGKLLEREQQISSLREKVSELEEKSQQLSFLFQQICAESKDREDKLQDIISFLSNEVKAKELKSIELERVLVSLKADKVEAYEALLKEYNELQSSYKFALDDLQLQLDNAQVQLREVHEFTLKKTALEEEISGLREQLEKERKEHQEAISDLERAALQDTENFKREMAACIEETKQLMIKQTDEQLQAKTREAIVENEQLNRKLGYQIKQTEALLQKNEKLVAENIHLHRQILLAMELEDDLVRKSEAHQRTMRILLFKLHEKHLASKLERKMEEEELQELISHSEALKAEVQEEQRHLKMLKDLIDERSKAAESSGVAEEAMKFLYTCLEDLEAERLLALKTDSFVTSTSDSTCSIQENAKPVLPNALEQLTLQQRKDFLKHLICTAVSFRAITHNSGKAFDKEAVDGLFKTEMDAFFTEGNSPRTKLSVEDILALPVGVMLLDEPVLSPDGSKVWTLNSASSGVQADLLEEPSGSLLSISGSFSGD